MKKFISTLLIFVFLFPFLIPFTVAAAPLRDDLIPGDVLVSSNGVTYYPVGDGKGSYQYVPIDDLTKKLTSSTGNSFKKFGKALLNGFEHGYGTVIYALKPESSYSEFDKDCVALIDKAYNGSATVSDVNEIFTISDNQLTIKDSFQVNINNIVEQASDEIDSNMILYQTFSVNDAHKFLNHVSATQSNFDDLLSNFDFNDYPLAFSRWNGDLSLLSLSNIGVDKVTCDGLILSSGNWSGFVQYFDTFQNAGYLNNVSGVSACHFKVYAGGKLYEHTSSDFKHFYTSNSSSFSNPLTVPVNIYLQYSDFIRQQTCIFTLDGSPMIFFKDSASYLNFWNNKYVVPYDFQNSNIDYSDFFNNLDQDALDIADNLSDIYDVLNNAVVEGLQDAVDRLTTTNQWLKKIYNKVDDWKKEWNLRNMFSTLTDIVGALDDLLDIQHEVASLLDNRITGPVIDNIQDMVEDATIASTLRSRFPFCIPIRMVDTISYLSSYEAKPLNFSVSSNALGFPFNFNFDYEDIPGNQIATLIVKSFIFLGFVFGLYKLTIRIIEALGRSD